MLGDLLRRVFIPEDLIDEFIRDTLKIDISELAQLQAAKSWEDLIKSFSRNQSNQSTQMKRSSMIFFSPLGNCPGSALASKDQNKHRRTPPTTNPAGARSGYLSKGQSQWILGIDQQNRWKQMAVTPRSHELKPDLMSSEK